MSPSAYDEWKTTDPEDGKDEAIQELIEEILADPHQVKEFHETISSEEETAVAVVVLLLDAMNALEAAVAEDNYYSLEPLLQFTQKLCDREEALANELAHQRYANPEKGPPD